ncbi:hypothetical protein C8R43DRAFT_1235158 [Mycena crocata]|nr:hypothetical protein C8R43DRAFT_1235158 [Mycena crocata]
MATNTFLSTPDKVSITYGGNTTLTVSPALASGATTVKKGDTITLGKSGGTVTFSVNNARIAAVWNHDDMELVEIWGGSKVNGTSPFDITVDLVQ